MTGREEGASLFPDVPMPRGQTIWAWLDYAYYDGLLVFAQGCHTGYSSVSWCCQPLAHVKETA